MTPEQFMLAEAGKPFRYGVTDCAQSCARWVEYRTGKNPLVLFSRDYGDAGAQNWLLERPLARSVHMVMKQAGFERVREPQVGDVGVIASQVFAAVAIRGTSSWVFITEAGGLSAVDITVARCIASWRI